MHFGCKEYIQSDFSVDHLVMSMCRVFFCVVGRVFVMTSAFSWQNSISLCPASFHTPRPNLPVTPGVSLEKAMQPTLVVLPGKSHGWGSLVGYSPWGCKELDTTERVHFHFHQEALKKHLE